MGSCSGRRVRTNTVANTYLVGGGGIGLAYDMYYMASYLSNHAGHDCVQTLIIMT